MEQWRRGGLVVRDAGIQDLDAIASLERASFPEDQVSRRSFAWHLRAPHRPVIAATIAGQIAGYVLVALSKGGHTARIYTLAVDPRFARRGVGSALLAAAEKYALRHEREALTLEVRYDNAPAIALYERCGFRPFGEHEDYYADGATALRYKKKLALAPGAKRTGKPAEKQGEPRMPPRVAFTRENS
ncbi:ribosomal-protein-alanine acetyltransferase [Roseiarcus fermentans]|uniref:Ribosomal-protein-alanine acetyltransferase n=1 Tax=Roseiarcus fermentans TaxID=1473586 RepID=A0A366ERX8_9HYPH|nr:GNAT family N-acetyltransferase [Roseiarcus fermentans]RBP05054.1 ribosomal-protein-alanine acetyltransferase [Roseiarcus fermentans]